MAVDLDTAKSRLLERRRALRELEAGRGEERQAVELDQTKVGRLSRMDALQRQAMAQETERRRRIDLQKIEAALARIESGDYGYCLSCGQEIGVKRLTFDPALPTCIDCARG
jgi:DnaK suppressor protein